MRKSAARGIRTYKALYYKFKFMLGQNFVSFHDDLYRLHVENDGIVVSGVV